MKKNQWQLIITNAALSYQQMAMPVRDMMLLEMQTADVMTIADAYGYPSVLLANEKGTTYSNQEGAERKFYQDVIVPECENYTEQLNDMLQLDLKGIGISYDYTWLPSLQEDEKLKASVRLIQGKAVIQEFQANAITWNEMREGLYLDTVAGMDKYYYELKSLYGEDTTTTTDESVNVEPRIN
jgi:phage portal protein BeeE